MRYPLLWHIPLTNYREVPGWLVQRCAAARLILTTSRHPQTSRLARALHARCTSDAGREAALSSGLTVCRAARLLQ
ncbi:hypothetical protein C0Q70_05202 [Pomacea canaliculata]|uniref:Uncharacterized protein n=1 Tax=Pomacea canaliculata TaxID=400727 RepID=A0A2T7PKK7_POMCA|nr:hypothetical protein C0Q70_05202 [Pomacea canaliculata]